MDVIASLVESQSISFWTPKASVPPDENWHWKRPWCWERLEAGEGDDRGRDGWMASLTQWAWVWASSRSWWWTEKPGTLQPMGLQKFGHDWVTELNWVEWNIKLKKYAITITNCGKYYKVCTQDLRNWIGGSARKFWFEKWSESWEILTLGFSQEL